jgi:hypothetical protein
MAFEILFVVRSVRATLLSTLERQHFLMRERMLEQHELRPIEFRALFALERVLLRIMLGNDVLTQAEEDPVHHVTLQTFEDLFRDTVQHRSVSIAVAFVLLNKMLLNFD